MSQYKAGDEYRFQVSREYIDEFGRRLDAVNEAAGKVIFNDLQKANIIDNLGWYNDQGGVDFDTVCEIMERACQGSTKLASALTCEFYDGLRYEAGIRDGFKAEMYEEYDTEHVRAAAAKIMTEQVNGNPTAPLSDVLSGLSEREINNVSRETVKRNAKRDPTKPRCASVPTSSNPCEWCIMRASAGFIYDQDSESHTHCKCKMVPGFNGNTKVEGYDQSAYEDQYNEAADAWRRGDIDDELRAKIEAAKEKHTRDLAEGKVTKKWDSTNAILMVMRDKRGK